MTEDEKRVYPGAPDQEPAPVFDQQQSLFEDENGTGIIGEYSIDEDSIEIYGENPPEHEDFAGMLTSEDPEELEKILEEIKRSVGRQITLSEAFAQHITGVGGEALASMLDAKEILRGMFDGITALIPLLAETNKYIMKAAENPKYKGISTAKMFEDFKKARETGEQSLFDQLLAEARALQEADKKKLTPAERIRNAQKEGNVVLNFGTKQAIITNKDYRSALTTIPNKRAYIKVYDGGAVNWSDIANNPDGSMIWQPPNEDMQILPAAPEIDIPLLIQIFTAIYQNKENIRDVDMHTITLYYPGFCRSMGITPRDDKNANNDILKKIEVFKGCVGVTNGNQYRKVLDVLAFDQEKQTITLASPYINHLIVEIQKNREDHPLKTFKDGRKILRPAYSHLVHSTIAKERNKAAVSIVYAIVASVEQRGTEPDSNLPENKGKVYDDAIKNRITYRTNYESILAYTPDIIERINAAKTTKNKNTILKRATDKAFELLKEKTDIFKYYKDFSITHAAPSMNHLDAIIEITHYGKDGRYKPEP